MFFIYNFLEKKNKIILFLTLVISIQLYCSDTTLSTVVEEIAELVNDKNITRPVVSIAGCSGVGKTYFSKLLLAKLQEKKYKPQILETDRFLAPAPLEYILEQSEFNNRVQPNCPSPVWQFDHRKAQEVLTSVESGENIVQVPRYDFENKIKKNVSVDFGDTNIILLEGTYALTGPETYNLAQFGNLKIFLTAKPELLKGWYCKRKKANGIDNPEACPYTTWDFDEDYAKVIEPSQRNADLIIEQDRDRNYILQEFE